MPVEIKEIVIRAILAEDDTSNNSLETHQPGKEELIQECVTQVLKVIKKQNRR